MAFTHAKAISASDPLLKLLGLLFGKTFFNLRFNERLIFQGIFVFSEDGTVIWFRHDKARGQIAVEKASAL